MPLTRGWCVRCVPSQMEGKPDPMGVGKPYGANMYKCTRYDIDLDSGREKLRELPGLVMHLKPGVLFYSLSQAVKKLSAKKDGKSKFYAELLNKEPKAMFGPMVQ